MAFIVLHGRRLTRPAHFAVSDPLTFARTIYTTKSLGRF